MNDKKNDKKAGRQAQQTRPTRKKWFSARFFFFCLNEGGAECGRNLEAASIIICFAVNFHLFSLTSATTFRCRQFRRFHFAICQPLACCLPLLAALCQSLKRSPHLIQSMLNICKTKNILEREKEASKEARKERE